MNFNLNSILLQQNISCRSHTILGYEPNAYFEFIKFIDRLMQTRSKTAASSSNSASASVSSNRSSDCFSVNSDNSSVDYYKPIAKRHCHQPPSLPPIPPRQPNPYQFDTRRAYLTSLCTHNTNSDSVARKPRARASSVADLSSTFDSATEIESQRRQLRSCHLARNQWVRPSLHRLTLIQEYLTDLKAVDNRLELSTARAIEKEEERGRIIEKLEDLVAVQIAEVKGTELGSYSELISEELFGNYQLTTTQCFDFEGREVNHTDLVEVQDPYSGGIQQGRVIQLVNNNIVLVRLFSTGKTVPKFGFEVRLLED